MTAGREQILAALDAAQALLDEARAALLSSEGTQAGHERDLITMGQAATLLGRTAETTTQHVTKHGLGVKVAGRWRVSRSRCLAWMSGQPYVPLTADAVPNSMKFEVR